MAKKKMTKTAKRRLTVLTPFVILAIGYCAFTLVTTVVSLYNLHNEEASLTQKLDDLKGESKELKNEINKLQDKDYVARYARENYLYTKDGEYVIKALDEEERKAEKKFEIKDDYIIYGGIVIIALILFYIIMKSRKRNKKSMKKKK